MVQIFITGDESGEVTVGGPTVETGRLFAFEWDFFANGFATPDDGDLEDPIFASWSISTPPAFGTATITSPGTFADWTYVLDETNPAVQNLDFGETLSDSFVVRADAVGGGVFAGFQSVDITIFGICFAEGTRIDTPDGPVAVEDLLLEQMVWTQDADLQPIRWVGSQSYDEAEWRNDTSLWPVCISAGALGHGLPNRDLIVSQQHRILLSDVSLEVIFEEKEVLVAAKHLCGLPGIEVKEPQGTLQYFHILCDTHQILKAEGSGAESMFLGDEALHALSSAELSGLVDRFALKSGEALANSLVEPTCRRVLKSHEAAIYRETITVDPMPKQKGALAEASRPLPRP